MSMVMILFQQICTMFLLMAVGFILFRTGKITEAGSKQMSFLVLYLSTPMLILESMLTPFDKQRLVDGVWVLLLYSLITVLSILVARLFCQKNKLAQFGIVYSNVGFMGIPLVRSLLGSEAVFYISLVNVVTTVFCWTYGLYLMTGSWKNISLRQIILNPCLLAVAAGLLGFIWGVRFPQPVSQAISALGNLNTGLAMILLGIYICQTKVGTLLTQKNVWIVCLSRLLVIPMLGAALLRFCPISNTLRLVLLIGACTPSAGLLPMLAQQFDQDYEFGSGVVGITTVLSLMTMPFCLSLSGFLV
ncbi:AEC family transporter [Erysipelotrichaceae bacterium RD49]|nr:AEC family transporter [Erysipelotrichaceae bacterium RD49]